MSKAKPFQLPVLGLLNPWARSWTGNISASPDFITDGHAIFVVSELRATDAAELASVRSHHRCPGPDVNGCASVMRPKDQSSLRVLPISEFSERVIPGFSERFNEARGGSPVVRLNADLLRLAIYLLPNAEILAEGQDSIFFRSNGQIVGRLMALRPAREDSNA